MDAVLGQALVIECHLPGSVDASWLATARLKWERWTTTTVQQHGAGPLLDDATHSRRRRRHRRGRQPIRHPSDGGAALRFSSISERDEGLYRCVASASSSSAISASKISHSTSASISSSEPTLLAVTPEEGAAAATTRQLSGDGDDNGIEFINEVLASDNLTESDPQQRDQEEDNPSVLEQFSEPVTVVYGPFTYIRVQGINLINLLHYYII